MLEVFKYIVQLDLHQNQNDLGNFTVKRSHYLNAEVLQ